MDSRETTSSRQASDEGSKRKHDLSSQIKSKRLKLAEKNKFLDRYLRPLECGWKRELVLRCIRRGGKSKDKRSADVYYYAPSGKKLRSTPEVVSYLRNNSNNDPLCKLSGEDFVFCSRVVSHHKNEWVRNARDRTLVSPKKGKRSSPKSPPKPDLTVTQRPVGRPKGSKKSGRTEPEPKSEDAAEGDDGGKAVLASKVKVERTGGGSNSVTGSKNTRPFILPSLLPKSSRPLTSSDDSSLPAVASPSSAAPPRGACNLGCEGPKNVSPTLECRRCLRLFHPECVAFLGGPFEVATFFCETCKRAEPARIAGRSLGPTIKLPFKMRKLSNLSPSTSQKHRNIVPATAKVTTLTLNLPSLPSSMPEAIRVPIADTSAKFTGNGFSARLNFGNPGPNLTVPFYAGNNTYLSDRLPSYFVVPQSPNVYPQNGAFVTQSAVNVYPCPVTGQSLLGTGYVDNVNSIFPSVHFQASSVAPSAIQSLNYQPLAPFCQTFTLGSQSIANLTTDSSQILHNGFSSFNVASSESRPSSDPIVRKRSKKVKRSCKKSSANISDASRSNAESAPGNLEGCNPADLIECHTTADNSPVPLPLFVHDNTSERVESTVSANGVISKIILPTYDVLRAKNGSDPESISAAGSAPDLCPIASTFSTKNAEESSVPDGPRAETVASSARGASDAPSPLREGNYSAREDAFNIRCLRKNIDSTLNLVEEDSSTARSRTSDEGKDDGKYVAARKRLDHNYAASRVGEEESGDDRDSMQNVKEFQEVNVDKESDANVSIESETDDAPSSKTLPPGGLNESIDSTIAPARRDDADVSSLDLDRMSRLTDGLLAKVFLHLTTHELLIASQVCQRWRQVSQAEELWHSLTVTEDLFGSSRRNFDLSTVLTERKPRLLDLRRVNFEKKNLSLFAEFLSRAPAEFLAGITCTLVPRCPFDLLRKIARYLPNLSHLSLVVPCKSQGNGYDDGLGNGDGDKGIESYRDSFVRVLTGFESLKCLQIWEEPSDDVSSSAVDEDSLPDEAESVRSSDGKDVRRFAELEELKLLGSSHVASLGFEKCLFSSTFDKLESLEVSNCLGWDEQMFSLLGNLVGLKTLDLRRGGNIPDLGLSLALARMKGLLQLKLSDYVLDWSVSSAIQKLPNLTRLHVRPETSHSGSDKAPYVNLCCMSAIWNHKNLQQLTWVTSRRKSGPGMDGLLPFQVFDASKLRGNKGPIDPADEKEDGAPKDKLLVLSVDDLRSKLQTSLPNTRVEIVAGRL